MRKILCVAILQIVLGAAVNGRSLEEVLGNMDRQIGLYGKQLSSQISDLSEPFHNWFQPTAEAQQNIANMNQQAHIPLKEEAGLSYQGNNAPPSWMTQNQNIPSWMINPPQNQLPFQRPTTQRPSWNQNVNAQPTQRPNPPQSPPSGPVQQQFTVPPTQNSQQPIQNHQTQAPVVQNTVPSWMIPTSQPNVGNSNNQAGSNPNLNQNTVNQPNQQNPVNQPNLNNQFNPNQQIPVTQGPVNGNPQFPLQNQPTQPPNQMITAPVIQSTQPPLTQPVQVTNPTQPQFTAPVVQSTTPLNVIQDSTTVNKPTNSPSLHITAPVIQNTQQPDPIVLNTPPSWNKEQVLPENQNSIPPWVIPTQQPIILPETPAPTSHPIFTAPVISRTQQQQIMTSTQSPWMPVAPQATDSPVNRQFPTAPSFTSSPRHPTAPSITMIPQFPSLNLIDSQQPQNIRNHLENEQNQPLWIQHVTNSQGVTFPAFTAPVIRKTHPPTNSRQNQLPVQNYQFTVPVITRSTTTTFPNVPIVTRPTIPATTTRPQIGTFFPIIPTATTTSGPGFTWPPGVPTPTTTRSPLFPVLPQTTTRQPSATLVPPVITTRNPLVPILPQTTTTRFPAIPQFTTRPPVTTTRPTIRLPVTTPRSPQAITRPPVITTKASTTERPPRTTAKEASRARTTPTPEIRQPPRNQQSINDIVKMTDNMLSSLNNQIWQSISRIG